ncbi:hypothetical protein CBOM_07581 [Ceraceosorus bombacis]|uniref:Uncharacterized protein n=1 Tax=Ceraceosorus bombacis TaxID=401625 RepID=A0A0P1BH15_9BASI|nr:hypothetical protein CBOM_07581 [Ceraceosorus bombacis]
MHFVIASSLVWRRIIDDVDGTKQERPRYGTSNAPKAQSGADDVLTFIQRFVNVERIHINPGMQGNSPARRVGGESWILREGKAAARVVVALRSQRCRKLMQTCPATFRSGVSAVRRFATAIIQVLPLFRRTAEPLQRVKAMMALLVLDGIAFKLLQRYLRYAFGPFIIEVRRSLTFSMWEWKWNLAQRCGPDKVADEIIARRVRCTWRVSLSDQRGVARRGEGLAKAGKDESQNHYRHTRAAQQRW